MLMVCAVVVADAGEGVLEVTMIDPVGHLLANQAMPVDSGVLEVVFTPKISGLHRGNVVFNRETVPGNKTLEFCNAYI